MNPAEIKYAPIELLFCKTKLPLSRLIAWGTGDPCSHLAIDLGGSEQVLHSDLLGLHMAVRPAFLAAHTIVATFKLWLTPAALSVATFKLLNLAASEKGAGYDFGAFSYLGVRLALYKYASIPLPTRNPFGDSHAYLCTEATYLLAQVVAEMTGRVLFPYDTDLGATTPWQLYKLLQTYAGGTNEIDLRGAGVLGGVQPRA